MLSASVTTRLLWNRYEEAFRSQLQELGEDPEQVAPWLSLDWLVTRYSHGLAHYTGFTISVIQVTCTNPVGVAALCRPVEKCHFSIRCVDKTTEIVGK